MIQIQEIYKAWEDYHNALAKEDCADPEMLDSVILEVQAARLRLSALIKMWRKQDVKPIQRPSWFERIVHKLS
jgi:hypothetical protein